MFNESWPWKRDLAVAADRLDEARHGLANQLGETADGDDPDEQETEAVYQVEREVMSGAFAVRRLIGMPSKVTKAARATRAVVTRFPLRPGATAPDVWDALGDLGIYDTGSPDEVTVSASELCNLFVHSLIFRLAWTIEALSWPDYWALSAEDARCEQTPTVFAGLLVASDKSSTEHLTLVSVAELVRIFQVFAEDEVTELVWRRDRRGRRRVTAM